MTFSAISFSALLAICMATSLAVTYTNAWGHTGHRVGAILAYSLFTPSAQHLVDTLEPASPSAPSSGGTRLGAIASWADQVRHSDAAYSTTGPYHYVNAPNADDSGKCGYDHARDCPTGNCVVGKLAEYAQRLRDCPDLDACRKALRFATHLALDLTMPFHVNAWMRSGLGVKAFYVRGARQMRRKANAHFVWDGVLVDNAMAVLNAKMTATDGAEHAMRRVIASHVQSHPAVCLAPGAVAEQVLACTKAWAKTTMATACDKVVPRTIQATTTNGAGFDVAYNEDMRGVVLEGLVRGARYLSEVVNWAANGNTFLKGMRTGGAVQDAVSAPRAVPSPTSKAIEPMDVEHSADVALTTTAFPMNRTPESIAAIRRSLGLMRPATPIAVSTGIPMLDAVSQARRRRMRRHISKAQAPSAMQLGKDMRV